MPFKFVRGRMIENKAIFHDEKHAEIAKLCIEARNETHMFQLEAESQRKEIHILKEKIKTLEDRMALQESYYRMLVTLLAQFNMTDAPKEELKRDELLKALYQFKSEYYDAQAALRYRIDQLYTDFNHYRAFINYKDREGMGLEISKDLNQRIVNERLGIPNKQIKVKG